MFVSQAAVVASSTIECPPKLPRPAVISSSLWL
jgi:hypothetical protein